MAPEPQEQGVIRLDQAAALLMISAERIRQLMRSGYIQKGRKAGTVSLVSAVQGYITFLKDEERRTAKSSAASAVQQARADEIRLRVEHQRGRLIETETAEAVFQDVFGVMRMHLDGLAARVTRDKALRDRIDGALEDILRRAGDTFQSRIEAVRDGREAVPAPPEDDP